MSQPTPAAFWSPAQRGGLWLALLVASSGLAGWAAPLAIARLIPRSVEARLAQQVPVMAFGPPCGLPNAPGSDALAALVIRLYPQSAGEAAIPITVRVVHNPTVNAFASLGGQVVVLSGLLDAAQSPEELAGVLAHELEHVVRRHVVHHLVDSLALSASMALVLGDDSALSSTVANVNYWANLQFSRHQETQADAGGLLRLARAHIDPAGLATFFARQAAGPQLPAFLSDHPALATRRQAIARVKNGASIPALTPAAWEALKHLCKDTPSTTKASGPT